MTLAEIASSFVVGFLAGIGATLFYVRWKMKRQLGNLEEQMGQVMDLTDDVEDMMPDEMAPEDDDREGSGEE